MNNCEICRISDTYAEATHTCGDCGLRICDNELNHLLDHPRIDSAANPRTPESPWALWSS